MQLKTVLSLIDQEALPNALTDEEWEIMKGSREAFDRSLQAVALSIKASLREKMEKATEKPVKKVLDIKEKV